MKSVADRLKDARAANGSSAEDVAKACGISLSAIQMYECGQRVPRDSIKIALANFYGKTVQELFF